MYKDLNKKSLFDNVNLGFEFEFFSPMDRRELSEKLSKALGKRVAWTDHYQSSIPVSQDEFKLEPDFSGGFRMNELITGVMPYSEAIHVMFKVCNFIAENGFTTDRTGIHINLSFNEVDLGLPEKLQNLNVFKYLLNLDEAKIFELWPSAKSKVQKIYKNSVLNITPKSKFIAETSIDYANPGSPLDFNYPHSKYFGLNFEKLHKNYLEIRYAGGKNYESHRKEMVELVNYITESLYSTLKDNHSYSPAETKKVKDLLESQRGVILSIKTYESFLRNYPDIKLLADLSDEPRIVEANYHNVREKLFDLITTGNLKKGMVNYDTRTKRVQLKACSIKEGFSISNIDLINCKAEGEFTNCEFYGCTVRSSHLIESRLITANDVRYSYLKDCRFLNNGNNRLDSTYISSSPEHPIYADLNECIVRSGTVSLDSKVDSKTEFIQADYKDTKDKK